MGLVSGGGAKGDALKVSEVALQVEPMAEARVMAETRVRHHSLVRIAPREERPVSREISPREDRPVA